MDLSEIHNRIDSGNITVSLRMQEERAYHVACSDDFRKQRDRTLRLFRSRGYRRSPMPRELYDDGCSAHIDHKEFVFDYRTRGLGKGFQTHNLLHEFVHVVRYWDFGIKPGDIDTHLDEQIVDVVAYGLATAMGVPNLLWTTIEYVKHHAHLCGSDLFRAGLDKEAEGCYNYIVDLLVKKGVLIGQAAHR